MTRRYAPHQTFLLTGWGSLSSPTNAAQAFLTPLPASYPPLHPAASPLAMARLPPSPHSGGSCQTPAPVIPCRPAEAVALSFRSAGSSARARHQRRTRRLRLAIAFATSASWSTLPRTTPSGMPTSFTVSTSSAAPTRGATVSRKRPTGHLLLRPCSSLSHHLLPLVCANLLPQASRCLTVLLSPSPARSCPSEIAPCSYPPTTTRQPGDVPERL